MKFIEKVKRISAGLAVATAFAFGGYELGKSYSKNPTSQISPTPIIQKYEPQETPSKLYVDYETPKIKAQKPIQSLEKIAEEPVKVNSFPEKVHLDYNLNYQLPERIKEQTQEIDSIKQKYSGLYEEITRHEGKRAFAYKDSKGILTVGIGFNLTKKDAKSRLERLGLNYQAVCNGQQKLSNEQMYLLMKQDTKNALNGAENYLGKREFNAQPKKVQEVLINMTYNMGEDKMKGFVKLKEALSKEDYETASKEMINSDWYDQTNNRSEELVNKMRSVK